MTTNCSANYLGLSLNSPIVIGACSLTSCPETVRELAIAGAGAIVLPSIFEEQLEDYSRDDYRVADQVHHAALDRLTAKSLPEVESDLFCNGGPTAYLELIGSLKATTGMPIIASMNGCHGGEWLHFARQIEKAGASAIEASLESCTTNPELNANEVEERLVRGVHELCELVSIPVSVKLSPYHSNLGHLAWELQHAGANGLVCFGHEPTWDVKLERIRATPVWGLTPASLINPTISGILRVRSSGPRICLAASGGISSIEDVIASVISGADVVMITSEIYRSGPDAVAHLIDALSGYLGRHGFDSYEELVANRPRLDASIRGMQLGCLTQTHAYRDPTPSPCLRSGDRWGHIQ